MKRLFGCVLLFSPCSCLSLGFCREQVNGDCFLQKQNNKILLAFKKSRAERFQKKVTCRKANQAAWLKKSLTWKVKKTHKNLEGFTFLFYEKKRSLGLLSLKARTETDQEDRVAWLFFFKSQKSHPLRRSVFDASFFKRLKPFLWHTFFEKKRLKK